MTTSILDEDAVLTDAALVLSPDMAGTLMTPEEFDAAEVDPDDGSRYELIKGMLIVTPIPSEAEADPNEGVIDRFRRTMTVYGPKGVAAGKTISEQGVYSTPLLPGFKLPLSRLFVLADAWKEK